MNFFLWVCAALVPLFILSAYLRAYPHWPLVLLGAVPAVMSIALVFWPQIERPVVILDAVFVAVAALDLLTLPSRKRLGAEREVSRVASLRKPHRVTLTIFNRCRRRQVVWVRDDLDPDLNARPDEFVLRLRRRSRTTVHYDINSSRRGAFTLACVYLRVRSLLGLWQRHVTCDASDTIHVYPDMKQLGEYAVLARTNRLSLMGVRRTRKIGQDNEFERLRDYTPETSSDHER